MYLEKYHKWGIMVLFQVHIPTGEMSRKSDISPVGKYVNFPSFTGEMPHFPQIGGNGRNKGNKWSLKGTTGLKALFEG